ncbi:MAG: tol-pal system YbgF family protein [Cardiobacterium sp.]
MQDDNALGYLNRSLQYLFRPGNLLYCGALAAVFIALRSLGEARMEGVGTLNWFIIFALIVLFACKMLDSMQRLMHGLEQERVPLTTISKLPKNIAIDAAVAIAFCGTVVFLLQLMFTGDRRPTLLNLTGVILYALTPALILSIFQGAGSLAILKPAAWRRAVAEIGGAGRYLAILAMPFLFAALVLTIYTMLAQTLISAEDQARYNSINGTYGAPAIIQLITILRGIIFAFLLALPLIYFSWYFPPPEETLDPDNIDIDERELAAHINMNDDLLAELNRLKAEEERHAQLQRRAPPVDLNLLREADTEGMSADEQRRFAGDLTQADVLIRQGENEQAIALLEPYADSLHDTNRYLPACKRLHQLYRRQGREDAMQAMEMRLIEATASGNPYSYPAIHQTLDETGDGILPADWIYPLAQIAAGKQHYDTVLNLTRNFAKHHPRHPQLVENYFLAARALAKKGESDKAQQLLQQLLKRYPDHAKATQIRRTLELLQQRT